MEINGWQKQCGFTAPSEKLKIYYSLEALIKTIRLVEAHSNEIGWDMIVKKYKDGYKVYDIFVYPQDPTAAYISVDIVKAYSEWKGNLDREAGQNLFGQGHSHVDMEVFKSGTDEKQQHDEIQMMNKGFFLYQIWNKKYHVRSYFYDLDEMVYYEDDNIEIILETIEEFINNSFEIIKQEVEDIGSE